MSHLEKSEFFVSPPSPRVNVALKKGAEQDDSHDSAAFCGTATLTMGEGGDRGKKTEYLGVARKFTPVYKKNDEGNNTQFCL